MNVLVVSCHPDDMEIACGGTIRKYVKAGHSVTICHAANGNMGHVLIEPDELRRIRDKEARAAGAILGVKEVTTLDADDLTVNSYAESQTRALVELIRRVYPDVILTHAPNDYMKDHRETGLLAFDASFCATIAHLSAYGTPTNAFPTIYYMDTLAGVDFSPDTYVNVTDEMDDKLKALNAHASQIRWMYDHDHIDFCDMVVTCAKYRGYQSGVKYAEAFQICKAYPRMTTRRLLPLDD